MPQSTQMCVKVATLSKPLINNLTSVMKSSQTQSTSTSIAWQYKHNVIVTPKVWMQGNRFLPHQLLPNTHMWTHPTHAMFEGETNAYKLGMKGIWSKCELSCTVDEDDSHSKLLIILRVTLRSIYHEQAIVTTHKQSLKRSERTKKTIRRTSKPSK